MFGACRKITDSSKATHLRELGAPEWNMPSTAVQCADAFLQRQQTLVDFSAFQARLPVIVIRVCSQAGTFIYSGQCCQC